MKADPTRQLQRVRRKFEVDEPAGAELYIERTLHRLVPPDLGPHFNGVANDFFGIARHPQDILDQLLDAVANLGRSEHRACATQRHMLPRPRFLALIALEGIERDDQHPLRAFGPEARIDVVQRSGSGRYAECRSDTAGEAVEIVVRAEGLRAIGHRAGLGG